MLRPLLAWAEEFFLNYREVARNNIQQGLYGGAANDLPDVQRLKQSKQVSDPKKDATPSAGHDSPGYFDTFLEELRDAYGW